jgi:hypothetical protein
VGKAEAKRLLGRPRCQWEGNIKMDLREIDWGSMDRIDLTEDSDRWRALLNMVLNLWVPQNVRKFLSNCATCGF